MVRNMKNSLFYDHKGSLTLEATLIISIVMIFSFSWILLFRIWQVQEKSMESLDQAALTLSDIISWQEGIGKDINNKLIPDLGKNLSRKGKNIITSDLKKAIRNLADDFAARKVFLSFFMPNSNDKKGSVTDKLTTNINVNCLIDDENDSLKLLLEYDLELPGVLRPLGPLTIKQNSQTGIWLFTDDPIGQYGQIDEKKDSDNRIKTIWQNSSFDRGREFVKRYKGKKYIRVKSGQRIDYIDGKGKGVAIYSLNIFSTTYSKGKGFDARNYEIKEENYIKKIKQYISDLKKQLGKEEDIVIESDKKVKRPKQGKLLIILPEEASFFEDQLNIINKKVDDHIVTIEYIYDEKALINEEKVKKGTNDD